PNLSANRRERRTEPDGSKILVAIALVMMVGCTDSAPTPPPTAPSVVGTDTPTAESTPEPGKPRAGRRPEPTDDPNVLEAHRIADVPRPCRDDDKLQVHMKRSGGLLTYLDADRRRDLVYYAYRRGAILGICLEDGTRDEVRTSGMAEMLSVFDLQPDGRYEILFGGNSAVQGFEQVAIVRAGRLVVLPIRGAAYDFLVTGTGSDEGGSWYEMLRRLGCEDVTGDDARELVHETLTRKSRRAVEVRWRKRGYTIRNRMLVKVLDEKGTATLDSPSQRHFIRFSVTRPCPFTT
ncbi:MAG: hypothetical protein ACRD1T_11240, partial [Acidimicrobiia bacterium]